MTATPVINPVVILSTYSAFSGNLTVVIGRVCLELYLLLSSDLSLQSDRRKTLSYPEGRLTG
jgi:uncharacterized membrane protein YraQ (UPF0718 family)